MRIKQKPIDIKKAPTREVIAFSVLPFGIMMVQNVLYNALDVYLADILGIGLVATGIILALSRLWDAVNDPLMGMMIDRTRTKWGECKPCPPLRGGPHLPGAEYYQRDLLHAFHGDCP